MKNQAMIGETLKLTFTATDDSVLEQVTKSANEGSNA